MAFHNAAMCLGWISDLLALARIVCSKLLEVHGVCSNICQNVIWLSCGQQYVVLACYDWIHCG
jgi:hypothetical protein